MDTECQGRLLQILRGPMWSGISNDKVGIPSEVIIDFFCIRNGTLHIDVYKQCIV